jgi:hypothetical protein
VGTGEYSEVRKTAGPPFRAEAAIDRTTLASDRRIAGAHILAQRTKIVR